MKFIPAAVSNRVGRAVLQTQKVSPTLLLVGGIGAVTVSTVLACRATLNLSTVLDENHKQQLAATETFEDESNSYGQSEYRHDIIVLRTQAATKVAILYSPAVTVGIVGIAMLVSSHNILNKRNAALTAAYATVDRAFKDYRERVRAELGVDKERELFYDTEDVEVTDPKTGKTKVQKRANSSEPSMYARVFNESNDNWNPNPEYNIAFLRQIQNYVNDRLKSRGHMLLNDVYDALGLDRSTEGCVVGWRYDESDDSRDNYIDFGIFGEDIDGRFYEFMVGREDAIVIDFNVDGVIYEDINRLPKKNKYMGITDA